MEKVSLTLFIMVNSNYEKQAKMLKQAKYFRHYIITDSYYFNLEFTADTPFGQVKLSELGSWIARRNKTPSAIAGAFSRGNLFFATKTLNRLHVFVHSLLALAA